MQQRYSETLELAKCVVKDVNFHVNKCSYGYKALKMHNKVNATKAKEHITTSKMCS